MGGIRGAQGALEEREKHGRAERRGEEEGGYEKHDVH